MKTILPINKRPYIISRTGVAFQLGAIEALPGYSDAWICDKFINLKYEKEDSIYCDFAHKDFWFIQSKMFTRQSLLFSKETLNFSSFNVIDYIICAIREGKYVAGDYNSYYIPNKNEYNVFNRRDTYLIYGYDKTEKMFYIMGNTKNGYGENKVSFLDYINSISNRDDGMFNINIMEYNKNFSFDFSEERFRKEIYNYMTSQHNKVFYDIRTPIYGINAIKELKKNVALDFGNGEVVRNKSFLVLYEHKKIMLKRLYYIKCNMQVDTDIAMKKAEESFELTKKILACCKDIMENRGNNNYSKIIEHLSKIIENDYFVCSDLLERSFG